MKSLVRTISVGLVLCLYPLAIMAQYVDTTQGSMLIYQRYNTEGKKVGKDTSIVLRTTIQDDKTIVLVNTDYTKKVNQKTDADNSKSNILTRFLYLNTYIYEHKTGVTQFVFLDSKAMSDTVFKECINDLEKESEQELDADEKEDIRQESDKMFKGCLDIPLIPNSNTGESFAESEFVCKMGIATMRIQFTDCKYLGNEVIETPIGEFSCLKLSYTQAGKLMGITKKYFITNWYAEGVGLVKEECRNKKGKIESSKILLNRDK